MELKPDLQATDFSYQNAFFFAKMSKIVYFPKSEVRGLLKGNETSAGMGFDHFYWYEVRTQASTSKYVSIAQKFVQRNNAGKRLFQ